MSCSPSRKEGKSILSAGEILRGKDCGGSPAEGKSSRQQGTSCPETTERYLLWGDGLEGFAVLPVWRAPARVNQSGDAEGGWRFTAGGVYMLTEIQKQSKMALKHAWDQIITMSLSSLAPPACSPPAVDIWEEGVVTARRSAGVNDAAAGVGAGVCGHMYSRKRSCLLKVKYANWWWARFPTLSSAVSDEGEPGGREDLEPWSSAQGENCY